MDGARNFKRFRLITLPLLLVAVTPLLIARFAFNFNNFNQIYLLTGGGPVQGEVAGRTDILITTSTKSPSPWSCNDYGLAAASRSSSS